MMTSSADNLFLNIMTLPPFYEFNLKNSTSTKHTNAPDKSLLHNYTGNIYPFDRFSCHLISNLVTATQTRANNPSRTWRGLGVAYDMLLFEAAIVGD